MDRYWKRSCVHKDRLKGRKEERGGEGAVRTAQAEAPAPQQPMNL